MSNSEKKFFTKTEVKALGFNEELIELLLPEPIVKENPYYKSAAQMNLWNQEDVERAMETEEFKAHLKKRVKRQESAKKAVETKKAKLRASMALFAASIRIKCINMEELRKRAIEARQQWYNQQCFLRGKEEPLNAYDADEATVRRWEVNYVRHEMTSYDKQLLFMRGKTGISELAPETHDLILDEIAKVYPELSEECGRQKHCNI